ncbi:MAG: carbon starvation protein A, partial [Candidatus Hydrogenedentes bacterium]|nr:carbon starvation protein A [Candidatus Hydrogenedentota bacterium]
TTLDTATRLQRYVIQELGAALNIAPLRNKYAATSVAVLVGLAFALLPGPGGPGTGGLILWPLFGAVNQLLAGLAFLVIAFYLIRHDKPIWFLVPPGVMMVILPAWAMTSQVLHWIQIENWLLAAVGIFIQVLQVWMIAEGVMMWKRARGVPPQALPALRPATVPEISNEGGRSC